MSEEKPPEANLGDEFRNLGKNLVEALRGVWDSPERKRLTEELDSNLTELSTTLRKELDSFNDSPTGQRLKEDVDTLHGKVRSELNDSKVKDELLAALRTANNELSKVVARWSGSSQDRDATQAPPAGEDDPASQDGA